MINFCNKECYLFDNKINLVQCIINDKYENVLEIPTDKDYLITTKFNKTFLLNLVIIDNKKYTFFIDLETNNYIYCKFRFKDEYYQNNGTLFKGEFYKNNDKWIFYISTILIKSGEKMDNILFSQKLEIIYNILKNDYIYDEYLNICSLEIKPYFLSEYISSLKDNITLYFIPENSNDNVKVFQYSNNIEKCNNILDNNTQKMKICNTLIPDVYYCYDNVGNNKGPIFIKNLNESKLLEKYFKSHSTLISSCFYNYKFKKWCINEEISLN